VTLIADDAVSGTGHVAYKLDGGDWVRVEGDEAAVRIGGAGAHVLAYQAVDAVGNRSPEQTRTITIRPGDSRSVLDVAGFGDWTANPRTTFTAAPRFGPPCPAQATLVATRDAGSGGRDALLGFALPAAPDCVVASARLRLYAPPAAAGSRVDVARASAAWSEAAVDTDSWPGLVGAVANATVPDGGGWAEWDVAAQVQALYRHGDNGLQARAGAPVAWCTREANTAGCGADRRPELVLRFAE
jgi:hypothetical protein